MEQQTLFTETPSKTAGWSDSELDRQVDVEAGRAVVANAKTDTRLIEWAKKNKRYTYIGRGSKWGNLHQIGQDGDRKTVWLKHAEGFGRFHEVDELKGRVLGCYCHPLQCHGDMLAWWANGPKISQRGVINQKPCQKAAM